MQALAIFANPLYCAAMEFEPVKMRYGMIMPGPMRLEALRAVLIAFAGDGAAGQRLVEAALSDLRVLEMAPGTLAAKLEGLETALGVTRARIAEACRKYPGLLYRNPVKVGAKIEVIAGVLRVPVKSATDKVLAMPALAALDMRALTRRFRETAEILGLQSSAYARICAGHPRLLIFDTQTLRVNAEQLCTLLSIERSGLGRLLKRGPGLLASHPGRLRDNLERLAGELGVPADRVARSVCRFPKLAMQKPETLIANLDNLSADLGLVRSDLARPALAYPPILYLRPASITAPLREFAEGIGVEFGDAVRMLLASPSLAGRKADGLIARLRMCQRIAKSCGNVTTAADMIQRGPCTLTYSMEHLRERWLVARIGGWSGSWVTLVCWSKARSRPALERQLTRMPLESRSGRFLRALLDCQDRP